MDTNYALLALRPVVDIEFTGNKTLNQQFMHDTLRPVLKLQNDKILMIIDHSEGFNKAKCTTNDETTNFNYLKEFLSKNIGLKNQLNGIILGVFTQAEMIFYLENKKEISKRMSEMIVVRYLSSVQL